MDAAPGVLLPGEDPAERAALDRAFRGDLRPATPDEEDLVARMAEAAWHQRRAEAAAYAAAGDAIAAHGPGTNVLVMEACAGGRGPFFRAEGWNLRLTGRLIRLVRRLTAAQRDRARADRDASRSRGTKPLSRAGAGETPPALPGTPRGSPGGKRRANSRSAGNKAIARQPARATPRPEWSDGPDRLTNSRGPPCAWGSGASQGSARGVGPTPRTPPAGNKAIAPFARPAPSPVPAVAGPMSAARNKPIAAPRAARTLARAVGAVVTGMVNLPLAVASRANGNAEGRRIDIIEPSRVSGEWGTS
jgi:hypothetical protein